MALIVVIFVDNRHNHLQGKEEMLYLTTHSVHFIFDYMASDIWLRVTQKTERGNPLPTRHGLIFFIYAPSHRGQSDDPSHQLLVEAE